LPVDLVIGTFPTSPWFKTAIFGSSLWKAGFLPSFVYSHKDFLREELIYLEDLVVLPVLGGASSPGSRHAVPVEILFYLLYFLLFVLAFLCVFSF